VGGCRWASPLPGDRQPGQDAQRGQGDCHEQHKAAGGSVRRSLQIWPGWPGSLATRPGAVPLAVGTWFSGRIANRTGGPSRFRFGKGYRVGLRWGMNLVEKKKHPLASCSPNWHTLAGGVIWANSRSPSWLWSRPEKGKNSVSPGRCGSIVGREDSQRRLNSTSGPAARDVGESVQRLSDAVTCKQR